MTLSFFGGLFFFIVCAAFGLPGMFVLAVALDRREAARMKRKRNQKASKESSNV